MNKKVLTLCAGFLLAGSLTAVAQYCPQNGEVDYRTRLVKAAELDATFQDVKKINQKYYYQLEVNPASLASSQKGDVTPKGTFVLTAERDYSTGKIYLTAQRITNATLTHSLWKIKPVGQPGNGQRFVYENLETGYVLTFDHTNALQANPVAGGEDIIIPTVADKKDNTVAWQNNAANFGWTYGQDGLMDGCTDQWAWYTVENNGASSLGYKKVFSYFHNETDSVMALRAIKLDDNVDAIADRIYRNTADNTVDGLSDYNNSGVKGLKGTGESGYAIVAVKDSEGNAQDWLNNVEKTLEIKPVVAGAKVLDADEINTMIDADGSFLTFEPRISSYRDINGWNDAKNGNRAGKKVKMTVLNPVTGEPLTIATDENHPNPFEHAFKNGWFTAKQSVYANLEREKWAEKGAIGNGANPYAGYNILFETNEPIDTDDEGQKQYGYLYVGEHNYEGTNTGTYNGLEVKIEKYGYLTNGEGDYNLDIVHPLRYNDEINGKASLYPKAPDALEARYHWKVTYYATNDSLVLEPLNASRMNRTEMGDRLPFDETHLANHGADLWLNTVNAANQYDGLNEKGKGTSMYAKAAGVPVALFAINNSSVGDNGSLLTVGSPESSVKDLEAGNAKWAAVYKDQDDNPAYVTNKIATDAYQSEMGLRLTFVNDYTYLQRATMDDGVYFMNLKTNKFSSSLTENRVDGAYIVEDMKGHVVYDTQDETQDFTHMPATQWVIEQQPCLTGDAVNTNENPVVAIYNREFNGKGSLNGVYTNKDKPVFEGQLYTAGDGKFFTINHRDYGHKKPGTVDHHYNVVYNCADTVTFTPVEVNELGYFNEEEDVLRDNVYQFQHMYDMGLNAFLGVGKDNVVKLVENGETQFELFRAQGWYPVAETKEVINRETGVKEVVETGTYKFEYRDSIDYGYASEVAKATQLRMTFYKVKVKDANLIDNDHTFLAIDNQHVYRVATEEEIENKANHLSYAVVALKEHNHLDGNHGYALINVPQYTFVDGNASELKGLKKTTLENELSLKYDAYFVDVDANDTPEDWDVKEGDFYNPEKDIVKVRMNINNYRITGKLAVEDADLNAKIADLCETTTSSFALVQGDNKRYATLPAEYVNNAKKVIDLVTIDEQSNQSLYEDSGSKLAIANGLNYLAAENLGDQTDREGFYVDKVAASSTVMPQYMLVVAADSVPAYTYCDCDIHNVKHGINSGCEHSENFAGYVEGRFLVNFNDSVQNAINRLENADKFRSSNYTRLGFVEAVHRGDSLYVLKAPYTLASIKEAAADGSGDMIINPLFLSADSLGKVYDIVPLDGKHNNAVFAFRNTGDEYNSIMLESNDSANKDGKPYSVYSGVGSFAGAWVKLINGVPVLAKYYDVNGNHNTGDSTDSWKDQADWQPSESTGEVINQGARFTFSAIDKDASATANEEIAAGTVTVVATDGAVIVKGAEGKNVIVSTILGKVVANETINSDNETIAAPAGIVVVSVDGESFKVVVK